MDLLTRPAFHQNWKTGKWLRFTNARFEKTPIGFTEKFRIVNEENKLGRVDRALFVACRLCGVEKIETPVVHHWWRIGGNSRAQQAIEHTCSDTLVRGFLDLPDELKEHLDVFSRTRGSNEEGSIIEEKKLFLHFAR